MERPAIIEIKNGSIGYGEKWLLQGLDLSVTEGSIVALLGLNGTGKSSLLRTIAGLQTLNAGEIFFKGKLYKEIDHDEMARSMAIVLTGRGEVIQSLTVRELLTIARSPYTGWLHQLNQKDQSIIKATIAQLNIAHLTNRKLFQLSDGEAQKIFIAKALIQEAPVILMDEPTAHLDIANRLEIFSLIKNLAEHGKTILLATHELDLAIRIADACLLIDHQGNYVFNTTDQLIETHALTKFFNNPHYRFNENTRKFEVQL